MKLIVTVVLLVVLCGVHGEDLQVRSWFTLKALLFSNDDGFGCSTEQTGVSCKDCNTLIRCDVSKTISCSTQDPSTPFCNPITKKCQAASTCLSSKATAMKCQYTGFFPDPLNCNLFWFCAGKDAEAQSYACPTGYAFDNAKKVCATGVPCVTFSVSDSKGLCKGKLLDYVRYPTDYNLYMLCDGENQLASCESPYERFNLTSSKCDFVCKSEGFFPAADASKFHVCVKAGTSFRSHLQNCAKNTQFDAEVNFCAPTAADLTSTPPAVSTTAATTTTNE